MKLIMLAKVSSGNRVYPEGETVELPQDKAEEFISRGYAKVWVEKPSPKKKSKPDIHDEPEISNEEVKDEPIGNGLTLTHS